jgi:hypothetical protein
VVDRGFKKYCILDELDRREEEEQVRMLAVNRGVLDKR